MTDGADYGDLQPILFHCETGDHLVSRGDAIRRGDRLTCPRHYRNREPEQQPLVTDGGRVEGDTDHCTTCEIKSWSHESEGSLIPVWENIKDYEDGQGPDYIGCTECCTMRPVNTDTGRSGGGER